MPGKSANCLFFLITSREAHAYLCSVIMITTLRKSLFSYRFKFSVLLTLTRWIQRQQKLPWKRQDLADVCRKHNIVGKGSVYPETIKYWCCSHKPSVFSIFLLNLDFSSLGICKAAWRILRVHELMLEQLKSARWNHPRSNALLCSLVKETRPLHSNPVLIGQVQPECQVQPKAGDFQSCLTTNPLPKSTPYALG